MNEGRTIFSQLLELAPHHHFRRCVERYRGNLGPLGNRGAVSLPLAR